MKPATLFAALALAATTHASETRSIPELARDAGVFKTLLTAVDAAGLAEALSGPGPFTVFAPTDDAFAALSEGTVASLLEPENRERLQAILKLHVVPASARAVDALTAGKVRTLAGASLEVRLVDGRLRVGDANVVKTDLAASNGVIHVIDAVLLPEPAPAGKEAALLVQAIDRGVPLFNAGQAEACAAVYEIACRAVIELGALPEPQARLLREALEHGGSASERAWALRRAMDRVLDTPEDTAMADDAFEPRMEAPLPEGFPGPGPVGRVVVKEYPRYRAAQAAGGMGAFWTLFNHIKRNEIAMTAPVEMAVTDMHGQFATTQMAFLYESTAQGETGKQGSVEVADLPPARVVSIGLRGPLGKDKLAAARKAVEERAAREGWVRHGGWRLMGYNIPMVPEADRFYELQLPVREPDQH